MALHKLIPDHLLPGPLLRPLEFGNRDQIGALEDLEVMIQDRLEAESLVESGDKSKYNVEISYSGSEFFEVVAADKASAIKKAMEELEVDLSSVEIDSKSAVKVSLTPKK